MTIVEELDKMSGRPHRSKNIVDAMKYAFNIEKIPQNISEAVKGINGTGGGGYMGMYGIEIPLTIKSIPSGVTLNNIEVSYIVNKDGQEFNASIALGESEEVSSITVPIVDGYSTSVALTGNDGSLLQNQYQSDYTGNIELDGVGSVLVSGSGTISVAWEYVD